MPLDLNFGGKDDDDGFPIVEEGVYELRVRDVEVRTNKAKTGQYLRFTYDILDEPYVSKKMRLWDNRSLSPTAKRFLRDTLEAITKEPWRDDNMSLDPKDLVGLNVKGIVVHETYEDTNVPEGDPNRTKITPRIKEYLPSDVEPETFSNTF